MESLSNEKIIEKIRMDTNLNNINKCVIGGNYLTIKQDKLDGYEERVKNDICGKQYIKILKNFKIIYSNLNIKIKKLNKKIYNVWYYVK